MKKVFQNFHLLVPGFLMMLCSCLSEDEAVCIDVPTAGITSENIKIDDLTDKTLSVSSRDSLSSLLKHNPVLAEVFLKRTQYPDDSVMLDALMQRFTNPFIDTLGMEVDRVYDDNSFLEHELGEAFSNFRYYYPEINIPKIETVATGLEHDLFVSDTLIMIGVDYFLGTGAKYRPLGLYKYMLQRYNPEYIVPSVMLLYGISPKYNATDMKDKTMLADMISYGKAYYFARHMLPCVPDSIFLSYTKKEMEGVRGNADIVWAHFLDNQLLFETDYMIKKKYIEERPKTYEIGEEAPGRIGTWLGWEIVRSYMKNNPGVTLQDLMKIKDAKLILDKSHYKP